MINAPAPDPGRMACGALASCCLALCAVGVLAPRALAIETGSTIDTTSPGNAPWGYVGAIGGASGVYLGAYNGTYWVLTAAHIGAGSFTLNGTTFGAVNGSAQSITNTDSQQYDGTSASQADLTLFQINGNPELANLAIATYAPIAGSTVEMIGNGGGAESWGDNTIYAYTGYTLEGYGFGGAGVLTLASGESGNGAQGIVGDSGGGMFYQTAGGSWELLGILSGVGQVTGNSGQNLGQGTIAVDLAPYSSQIASDIQAVADAQTPAGPPTDTPAMPPWALAGMAAGLAAIGIRFLPGDRARRTAGQD
jgi:hypothetical protein